MTREQSLIKIIGVAIALLAGSCTTGADDASTTSTVTPDPTTTTTTTSTTTTTTFPPGLQPQVLTYGATDNELWTYDISIAVSMEYEIVEFEFEDMTVDDLTYETKTKLETDFAGTHRVLFLEVTPGTTYEAVSDVRFDEGTTTVTTGQTEVTETLTSQDLSTSGYISAPIVMTRSGDPSADISGAPDLYRVDESLLMVLGSLGPAFGNEPVDVGDSWPLESTEPVYGAMSGEATISDEIEIGDDFAFVIDFAASLDDLPVETTLEELAEGALYDGGSLAMVTNLLPPGSEMLITSTDASVSGTTTFMPSTGVPQNLAAATHDEFTATISDEYGRIVIDYVVDTDVTYELRTNAQATSFEATAVLDQFEPDPDILADLALDPLFYYYVDVVSDESFESIIRVISGTPNEVAAGFSSLSVIGFDDETVDVVVLTNDGNWRGYPELANELIYFWTEKEGRSVSVNGATAYRTTIDGREWLVWSSRTHTFILIGNRGLATDALSLLIDADDPYLWQPGDCLEFDELIGVPFAPYGELGLAHCSTTHNYEVLHSEILPEGPNEPYPDDIGDRVNRACGERFHEHVGAYPLESAIDMIRYLPSPDEWDRGDRYIACVIYLEDDEGLVTTQSRLEGAGVENPIEINVSTCLNESLPVPCSEPHTSEVTAVGQYESEDPAYPDFEDVFDELDTVCDTALDEYAPTEGELELDSAALSDMPLGWDSGVRDYYCIAYAIDEFDFWARITGSIKSAWEIAPNQVDA